MNYTLLEYIKIFLKYWKIIVIFTVAVSLITMFVVLFVMDPIYLSNCTIKTATRESGISNLMNMASLPGISEFSELSGGTTLKEIALYENILLSRKCAEETINKFSLNDEWKLKYMYDAVKHFRESVIEIKKDKIAGTMEIGVYDKNPYRAKEIVEFLISKLNNIYIELSVMNAKNNREFIENRYNEVRKDLKVMEDSLKNYQDTHGIAPEVQVQAALKVEIEIEAQIKSEEVKLELLKKILSPEESEIKVQEEKIYALKKQLNDIRNKPNNSDLLSSKGMPEVVLNYLRLKREVEIQNKILTTLIPLLEQAKIEEKRDTPTVLIMDPPNVPDKKARPKRMVITAIMTFIAFVFSYSSLILYTKIRDYRNLIKNNVGEDGKNKQI